MLSWFGAGSNPDKNHEKDGHFTSDQSHRPKNLNDKNMKIPIKINVISNWKTNLSVIIKYICMNWIKNI